MEHVVQVYHSEILCTLHETNNRCSKNWFYIHAQTLSSSHLKLSISAQEMLGKSYLELKIQDFIARNIFLYISFSDEITARSLSSYKW
jgi:hypothetical protein